MPTASPVSHNLHRLGHCDRLANSIRIGSVLEAGRRPSLRGVRETLGIGDQAALVGAEIGMVGLVLGRARAVPTPVHVPHFAEVVAGTVGLFLRRGVAVAETADQDVQGWEACADQTHAAFGVTILY